MSDSINTNSFPVVTSLATYLGSSLDVGDYQRSQILSLIDDVDVIDVLSAQAMLLYILCEELTEAGVIESPEAYLQGLGARALGAVSDEG